MDDQLKDGLRIGNLIVVPRKGTVSGADGVHRLSADRIRLLLELAERAGEKISRDELADTIVCDADELQRHLEVIRETLGDTGANSRFLITDETGATLIAPVHAGIGQAAELPEADDEEVSFLAQLYRRKVIRVGAGYVVLSWVVIQVADTVLPPLGAPEWAITLIIAIAMIGFPVALGIAWVFEATSVGTLRDQRRVPADLSRKQKTIDLAVLAALVVVVGYFSVGVLTDVRQTRNRESVSITTSRVTAARNTIAVLPFRQLGASPENAYIGDGIAEEILRLLSRLRELNVAARTASFYFKEKDVDMDTIAQKLKVRHLLTGSVQIAGESIRVYAELVDASSGQQLWSESFDRKMLDIFAIQSEIARAVADESQVVLSDDSNAELDFLPTTNLEAYDYYLRGRDYLRKPRTADVLQNAQRLFHRALALDPDYALALAGQCETHLALYVRTKSVSTIDDAESVCTAALEVDESLPEVHTALGNLYWNVGDYDRAENQFRTAIDKNPQFYAAFTGLGDTLNSKNQHDEAQLAYQRLVDMQPGYWRGYQRLGVFHYRQGRDAEALPYFQQVTELTPDNAPGWNNLGSVSYMLGNLEQAANAWQRALELAPSRTSYQSTYSNLGTMYYYLGRYEDSAEMLQTASEIAPKDFRIWGRLAATYLQMEGRSAEAIAAYSHAITLANEIIEINPNESDARKNIALFYAHSGQQQLAEAAIESALQLSPDDPDTHFFAALTYLSLGDSERTLRELEQAVELGYATKLISSEPALAALKDNERFNFLISTSAVDAEEN